MLIRSLHAKNFRKYHKLEVDDIPPKGVITVAGLNESGKTSIGESICFALYGRTFVLDKKNLHKIISWGRDNAEVTLKFSAGDVQNPDNYTLYRSFHRDGKVEVNLQKEGSEDIVLDSVDAVSDTLMKILGFDYDAFASSFYLAQRELTTPDPNSDTIKKMAGIGDYGRLHDEFFRTNEKKEETIAELGPEVKLNQKNLDAMKLDETLLPELVDAEQILGAEQSQREALVEFLDDNKDTYTDNSITYSSAKTRRGFFGFLSIALMPIIVISWLLWIAGKYFPDRLQSALSGFLDEGKQSLFASFSENWLLPVAVVSIIAYFISALVNIRAKATMKTLSGEATNIASKINEGHEHITARVENLLPERVVQSMNRHIKNDQDTLILIPPREQFANLRQLIDDAPNYQSSKEEVTAAITRLSGAIKKQDGEIEDLGKGLLEDIKQEKIRSDEAGILRSTIKKLSSLVSKCERNIDVNNISIGLLQRAAVSSIELFNKNIANISANTLPKFTEGRYSEVSIGEDLSVKVYSDDKKDYMDFDEISSGTQRQIMLALRMAMSEELAINTGNTEQFIFLDEPFAFFDQKRTVSTLRALPDVSKVISQVWVVAQEFPSDVTVNKAIVCPLGSAELIV
ncbi:MAG: AAA family ATPase [Cocleimonas sp.]|nr:AAA family ATPase [Cocleimonas sp.]